MDPSDGSPRLVRVWTVPEKAGGVAATTLAERAGIDPRQLVAEVRHYLREAPAAWNPYVQR